MADFLSNDCPECGDPGAGEVGRREFIRVIGGIAAAAGTARIVGADQAVAEPAQKPAKKSAAKPAEGLIKELFAGMSDEQKMTLVHPFDHGADGRQAPYRLRTYNGPILRKRIGDTYNTQQQELVRSILKAMLSGEEAYERITRHGKWDGAGSFEGNSAMIFGDPDAGKFTFVFAGHHLTVRCDGNSEPGAAFGGPLYYGHSAAGYSPGNVYNYQTKQVLEVFDALGEKQREAAMVQGDPGDRDAGIRFRPGQPSRGVGYSDLSADQQKLVAEVMRTLLAPFRKEDGDEVMELVQANGGLEKIHLGFFKDNLDDERERWHYWRLEGPGFIWNYRVLPHVHCYVNIKNEELVAKS